MATDRLGTRLGRFFRRRPKEQPKEETQPQIQSNPVLVNDQTLHYILNKINAERIRRVTMLFDIRWLKEDNTSYYPSEEDIYREAYSAMLRAVTHGRVLGLAEIRDKGFIATYARLNTGNELLSLKWVLEESSNLG